MKPKRSSTLANPSKAAILAILAAQMALPLSAWANPKGENVTHGNATFIRNGNELIINQGSDKLITKWGDFSIGKGERTQFIQPSKNSAALNRVLGGSRSIIDGELSANGKVILINPAGVTVGPSGVVNVNSFTASTHDITDQEFIGGGELLYQGASQESIENLGTIRASGGDAILIAKHVKNAGVIEAKTGVVGLVGASKVLVKPSGSERIFIAPESEKGATVTQTVNGRIAAVSAEIKAAGNPWATAINLEGFIDAVNAPPTKVVCDFGGVLDDGTGVVTANPGTEVDSGPVTENPNGDLGPGPIAHNPNVNLPICDISFNPYPGEVSVLGDPVVMNPGCPYPGPQAPVDELGVVTQNPGYNPGPIMQNPDVLLPDCDITPNVDPGVVTEAPVYDPGILTVNPEFEYGYGTIIYCFGPDRNTKILSPLCDIKPNVETPVDLGVLQEAPVYDPGILSVNPDLFLKTPDQIHNNFQTSDGESLLEHESYLSGASAQR